MTILLPGGDRKLTLRPVAGIFLAFAMGFTSLVPAPVFAADNHGKKIDHHVAEREQDGTPVHVMLIARGDPAAVIRDLRHKPVKDVGLVPIVHGVSATMPPAWIEFFARDPNVTRIVYDAPVQLMDTAFNPAALLTVYPSTSDALALWSNPLAPLTGKGIGVAVIDSGIAPHPDFANRVTVNLNFASTKKTADDEFGHGTAVAGIIGGDGTASGGRYIGIAPEVTLLNLRVNDENGGAATSDIMNAILWAVINKDAYNIRVLNLSLLSSVAESYTTSPLDAAVEYAWLKGVAVVVAAGNQGPDTALYAPANDPYVISVGATDDAGTLTTADDTVAPFSSYGVTQDGFNKPDVVAAGRRIVSAAAAGSTIALTHPQILVGSRYVQMSGTSFATPQVAGIAALYLESHPSVRPGRLKGVLVATAQGFGPLGTVPAGAGAGYADAARAINYSGYARNINDDLVPNKYLRVLFYAANHLASGITVSWGSVSWDSVSWGSVSWGDLNWDAVSWAD